MATQEQFQQQLSRLDAATNQMAEKLRAIQEQLTDAGLSSEVEDSVLSQLTSVADSLEAMASSDKSDGSDTTTTA